MNSFYSESELLEIGFKSVGKNVKISRKASIYSPEKMTIGDNVRIDDFCILSGNITLGSHIHISAYVALYGAMGIVLEDFTGISPRSTIYSAMDDFSGDYLIGPIHPSELTNVQGGLVRLKKFSQIGCNSVIFPNIEIGEGTVVGACSLVNKSLKNWGIYVGVPAILKKTRNKVLLELISNSTSASYGNAQPQSPERASRPQTGVQTPVGNNGESSPERATDRSATPFGV